MEWSNLAKCRQNQTLLLEVVVSFPVGALTVCDQLSLLETLFPRCNFPHAHAEPKASF